MVIFTLGFITGLLLRGLIVAVFMLEKECNEDGRDKMDKDND